MGLFVVHIFCPYLCSCDSAALLSLRLGSLRVWIFLLGSSCAPRQQVPLMMGNYACGTSIMVQKYSQAAVYHFLRLSISLISYCRFLPTHSISHNSTNKILSKKYTPANIFFEFTLQELLLNKMIHFFSLQ